MPCNLGISRGPAFLMSSRTRSQVQSQGPAKPVERFDSTRRLFLFVRLRCLGKAGATDYQSSGQPERVTGS
jgi:hypothetical protein